MEPIQFPIRDYPFVEHDRKLLFKGSESHLLADTPNFFLMSMFRYLPSLNAITATKASRGTQVSVEARLEVFDLQEILYDVFAEAFGTRPNKVQPVIAQMSGSLFHIQFWPRYETRDGVGVTILGRDFVDTYLEEKNIVTRLIPGVSPARLLEDEAFLKEHEAELEDILRQALKKVANG